MTLKQLKLKILKNLAVFLLSLICLFFLGEFSLRLFSRVCENRLINKKISIAFNHPIYTILCIGNLPDISWAKSYPNQLQMKLDEQFGKDLVRVVTKNIYNDNTSVVIDKVIEKWLALYHVNIAIMQIGESNYWNLYEYSKFISNHTSLQEEMFNFGLHKIAWFRLFFSWYHQHINIRYKNINIDQNIENDEYSFYKMNENENQMFSDVLDFTRQFADFSRKDRSSEDKLLAEVYLAWLVEMGKKHPHAPYFLKQQARLHLLFYYDLEKGCEAFLHYLDLEPRDLEFVLRFVRSVFRQRFLMNPKELPQFPENFWSALKQKFPDRKLEMAIDYFQDDMIDDWVGTDIQKIINILRRRGITPVLQTYPPQHYGKHYRVNQVIREIATKNNLILVDQDKILSNFWSSDSFKVEDFYLSNGKSNFLNSSGHKFTAENIFNVIKDYIPRDH